MKRRILLVNPPVFDFSAYDFWLKPYGMLEVAGWLRGEADFALFDYLDRLDPRVPPGRYRADEWGRGEFYSQLAKKPALFDTIPRHYRRYGLPRRAFQAFLEHEAPFDYALVQTGMTYWYPGVREVIADLRALSPRTKIILGGVYATLCNDHARASGADLVVNGMDLDPLWKYLNLKPRRDMPALWELYPRLRTGVLKLADGCPFRCTYCSVPQTYPKFAARPLERSLRELELLRACGVENVVFYDDALLYRPQEILLPFLREAVKRGRQVKFHTPNALNARFVTKELAALMAEAGFVHVYLGFESNAYVWQKKTGGKVYAHELARAVDYLTAAGMDARHIHAYLIVGHPQSRDQELEQSMHYVNSLGIRVVLSEFSPIPGTPDGELCRDRVDLAEPLTHNKAAFTIRSLGCAEIQRLKSLAAALNQRLTSPARALRLAGQPENLERDQRSESYA
ncbi:MAG TPA: radical SAM protein [Candidatus Acidoferrales bacterium]|nr:radical SAM protein [Candidatus Acidoferrales bacterium]